MNGFFSILRMLLMNNLYENSAMLPVKGSHHAIDILKKHTYVQITISLPVGGIKKIIY